MERATKIANFAQAVALIISLLAVFLLCSCGNYQPPRDSYGSSDAAAAALLGGTAFLNGYNSARSPMVMCQRVGMMTLCN